MHRFPTLNLLLALSFLLSTAEAASAGGRAPAVRSTVTTLQGVRVSLWLTDNKRVYPRDALVPVTVRLRNVSRFPKVWTFACGRENPRVQVLNSQGTVRYPPGLALLSPPQCPAAGAQPFLAPGRTFQRQFLVVMRGHLLRAIWNFQTASSSPGANEPTQVTTGQVAVNLVHGPRPVATLHRNPKVYAVVQAPPGSSGLLRVVDVARCPNGSSGAANTIQNVSIWRPVAGRVIRPPCANPFEWHALAGWVNEPVVRINYVQHR